MIAGDDIGSLLLGALDQAGLGLQAGDVLAIAQKIVSKAEGRLVDLADVEPGEYAARLAEQVGKDPRLMELILRESEEVEAALASMPLVSAGATRMGDLVVCRILAGEAWHCHEAILAAWSVLRPALAGKPARPIRKC